MRELDDFLAGWRAAPGTETENRAAFVALKDHLAAMPGVSLRFVARPGVTYSLRARHEAQTRRELFVMVDVIEDSPRWLSVCFYQDLVTDPEERGDAVPGGLLGEDAICFDVESATPEAAAYLKARLDEAGERAGQGG